MILTARRAVTAFVALAVPASLVLAGPAATASPDGAPPQPGFSVQQVVNGMKLHHHYTVSGTRKTEPLSQPDDLTHFGDFLFAAFQNGVGSQGEPSSDGNTNSTVVEFTPSGHVLRQWDIKGKCDGLTADPVLRRLIATVNEDANSSMYTIDPVARTGGIQHYAYKEPLPHHGGTDAITIYQGQIFISASAPGTTGACPAAGLPGRLFGRTRREPRRHRHPTFPRRSPRHRREHWHQPRDEGEAGAHRPGLQLRGPVGRTPVRR